MLGSTVKVDGLSQPRSWADLEPGTVVAVPNRCWDYNDFRWTIGRLEFVWDRPPRDNEKAPQAHHAFISVSDSSSVWITKLNLLRVVQSASLSAPSARGSNSAPGP
jgi:hypothetical protein